MKLKWIVLCCLGLLIAQAGAEESIVIDAQSLVDQSGIQATDTLTTDMPTPDAPAADSQTPDLQMPNTPTSDSPVIDTQATDAGAAAQSSESTAAQAEAIKNRMPKDKMSPRQRQAMAKIELADENIKNGEAFQADFKTKPGVVALPSGVQYKILKAGKGKKPAADSLVECRYRGTLIDGAVFESTDARRAMSVYVSTFLPGLKEAVMLMPAGSKWQIVVPPKLAYRELGNRGVGPNATLIYEMELLAVK